MHHVFFVSGKRYVDQSTNFFASLFGLTAETKNFFKFVRFMDDGPATANGCCILDELGTVVGCLAVVVGLFGLNHQNTNRQKLNMVPNSDLPHFQ